MDLNPHSYVDTFSGSTILVLRINDNNGKIKDIKNEKKRKSPVVHNHTLPYIFYNTFSETAHTAKFLDNNAIESVL